MMKNKRKQGGALILALALMVSAFVLPNTYAATAVDVDAKCSVEVSAEGTGYSELNTLPVVVDFYKVADIDEQGEYNSIRPFQSMDFSDVNSETTAEEWEAYAAQAKSLVTDNTRKAASITLVNGSATATGLATGLYLVDAQPIESDAYRYEFKEYLVSLPNNYYYGTGNDDWVYDLTGANAIGLKPEREDLLGDLEIEKTLDAYNETVGGATFVFQVEAYKKDVDKEYAAGEKGDLVYSDVVSVTFDGPGTKKLVLEDIPAGAEVTVTEVYSGASYELVSDGTQTTVIIAEGKDGAPAAVAFENTYNEELNGGNGIVNSFIYDSESGSWTHQATADSTQ